MVNEIVCIDTQILIWGFKKQANPTQQDKIDKATTFVKQLSDLKLHILIPVIVLGELLVPIERSQHGAFIQKMKTDFMIAPYDTRAASIAADLWKNYRNELSNIDVVDNAESLRVHIKSDCMVVAIAIANSVNKIYSEDPHISHLCNGKLICEKMPLIPQQMNWSFQDTN
jgi:predicted nucleic acid-binding protein